MKAKRYFFSGMMVLCPFVLTLWVTHWIVEALTVPLATLLRPWLALSDSGRWIDGFWGDFLYRLLLLALLCFFITFIGFCTRRFMVRWFFTKIELLFSKIPFLKSIYRVTFEISRAVFSSRDSLFKGVVGIPFGDLGAIGLLVGPVPRSLHIDALPSDSSVVFMPTAPHPSAGFILFVPNNLMSSSSMKIEDFFKFLLSCGALIPSEEVPALLPPA